MEPRVTDSAAQSLETSVWGERARSRVGAAVGDCGVGRLGGAASAEVDSDEARGGSGRGRSSLGFAECAVGVNGVGRTERPGSHAIQTGVTRSDSECYLRTLYAMVPRAGPQDRREAKREDALPSRSSESANTVEACIL